MINKCFQFNNLLFVFILIFLFIFIGITNAGTCTLSDSYYNGNFYKSQSYELEDSLGKHCSGIFVPTQHRLAQNQSQSAPTQPGPGGAINYNTSKGCTDSACFLENPLGSATFTSLLEKVIGFLVKIGAPILVIMVMYGGFLILTAGDSAEKVKSGKDVILWAAVGYLVILCAWGIIYVIEDVLGIKGALTGKK